MKRYDQAKWNEAKEQAKRYLIDAAKNRRQVTYSELVANIHTISFTPHDTGLFSLLGEISTEEHNAGRGMLTAIVVHKHGDMEPGTGFYEQAESLGLDVSDELKLWVSEFKKVWEYWERSTKP